jgi:tRNA (cmo5U34)-methyltransferase
MKDWTFKDFADDFDAHVHGQLPWYEMVSEATAFIAKNYIPNNGLVYDIGCSTGNITEKLLPVIKERNADIVGIDAEESMIRAYATKFYGDQEVTQECVRAEWHEYNNFDVAIVFLTMMFIGAKAQEDFINELYHKLNQGGCIIVVDKTNDEHGYISTVFKRLAMHFKILNGVESKDILHKDLTLSGIQRPIKDVTEYLHGAKQFFQMGEFKGWVIEK